MNMLVLFFNKFFNQKSYDQIYLENAIDIYDLEIRRQLLDKGQASYQRYYKCGEYYNGW